MEINTIDFEPADVSRIDRRARDVVVSFNGQSEYGPDENAAYFGRLRACELIISDACIELAAVAPPFTADTIVVEWQFNQRTCFLPIDFEVAEPVRLSFLIDDVTQVAITGVGMRLALEPAK